MVLGVRFYGLQGITLTTCSLIAWGGLPVAVALLIGALRPSKRKLPTTHEAAACALKSLQEWAKWMSGIQTAVIGGLLAIIFKLGETQPPTKLGTEQGFVVAVIVSMGTALFFSAWVLFSIPSQTIRLGRSEKTEEGSKDFDVYEMPVYDWLPFIKLGYITTVQFCLWLFGLVFAGILILHTLPRYT